MEQVVESGEFHANELHSESMENTSVKTEPQDDEAGEPPEREGDK